MHNPYQPPRPNIAPQIHVPNRSNEQLNVVSFVLRETNSYNDQVYRPFQTQIESGYIEQFQTAFSDSLYNSPQSIAKFANNIIRPSAEGRGVVPIGEGWQTKRLIFLLQIDVNIWGGRSETIILSGYTEYMGANRSGALDPRMRLYFTNCISANVTTDNMGVGLQSIHRVSDVSQVIYDNPWHMQSQGFRSTAPGGIITLRPNDIFGKMQANSLGGTVDDFRNNNYTTQSAASDPVKFSKAINSSAPNYISKIVSNLKTAIESQDMVGTQWHQALGVAKDNVGETRCRTNLVFKTLLDRTDFRTGKSIEVGDLMDLSPHLDRVTDIIFNRGDELYGSHNTQHFNGSNYETIFASILGHSVPALMMECFIRSISFIAHNNTINCAWEVIITDIPQGFAKGIDLQRYLQVWEHRLVTEVLSSLMPDYYETIELRISCDIVRDTTILVKYGNNPETPFLNPSFGNTLTSPVVTTHQHDLDLITHDMEALCSSVGLDQVTGNSHGINMFS